MECLRLSGLLLIHTTHLKGTPKQHLHDKVATDLRETLEQVKTAIESSQTVAWMEIWVSFLGAHVSTNRGAFHLNCISRASELLGLEDWIEVRTWLNRFPYIDEEFDTPFQRIWTPAWSLRGMPRDES